MNYLFHFVCGASLCISLTGSGSQGLRYCACTQGGTYRKSRKSIPEPPRTFSWPSSSCMRNAEKKLCVCPFLAKRTRDATAEEGAGTVAAELPVVAGIGTWPLLIPGQLPPHCTRSCRRQTVDGGSDTVCALGHKF